MGVCKQWNGLLEWWNTRMVESKFYFSSMLLYIQLHTLSKQIYKILHEVSSYSLHHR